MRTVLSVRAAMAAMALGGAMLAGLPGGGAYIVAWGLGLTGRPPSRPAKREDGGASSTTVGRGPDRAASLRHWPPAYAKRTKKSPGALLGTSPDEGQEALCHSERSESLP